MEKRILPVLSVVLSVMGATGCGGAEFVNTAKLPDTPYCNHMKDICKEAREFEATFQKLSDDEKKDAENILKAYRMQCNDAVEACKKSAGK
ncbi:MAG: hypothetical protein JW863_13765 [Chitinispirillaceae bacterium]|nr:hypothetical protein [Chitinispirillaceae bacterium]